jgi:hypothetical protein
MKTYVVHSGVPAGKMDVPEWVLGIPKMLLDAKLDNVRFRASYCCTPDRKIIAEFESPDKDTLTKALTKIGMPFTAVMEATAVKPVEAKTFIVHSDIPAGKLDVPGWIIGIPKLLLDAKLETVRFKTSYCCTPDKKIICEFEGPDKDAVSKALNKIGVPFTAIMEVTRIGPEMKTIEFRTDVEPRHYRR